MNSDNQRKIKKITFQIGFLMEHQQILPEIRELALQLYPYGLEPGSIDFDSPEYMRGACDALLSLIDLLKQKGQ
jgi:hypothetical protein